jgi:hypothetical protein
VTGYATEGLEEIEQKLAEKGLEPHRRVAFSTEAEALGALRAGRVDAVTLATCRATSMPAKSRGCARLCRKYRSSLASLGSRFEKVRRTSRPHCLKPSMFCTKRCSVLDRRGNLLCVARRDCIWSALSLGSSPFGAASSLGGTGGTNPFSGYGRSSTPRILYGMPLSTPL